MSARNDKRLLRELARRLRAAVPPAERAAAAEAVAAKLSSLPELEEARLVLGYAATAEELDPAPALERLRSRGCRVAYPRVEGPADLSVRVVDGLSDLAPGALGIAEPTAVAVRVEPASIDAAIVPGIAFDTACTRLGHGAGYYDRLLADLRPGAVLIGVAFDEQVFAELPLEPHDVAMDVLVTPARTLRRE